MAVRVKLSDGTQLLVQATLDELEMALRKGAVLKIEQPDGRRIAITPQAVETMQEEPEAAAALEQRFGAAALH